MTTATGAHDNQPPHSHNPFLLLTMLCLSPTGGDPASLRSFAATVARRAAATAKLELDQPHHDILTAAEACAFRNHAYDNTLRKLARTHPRAVTSQNPAEPTATTLALEAIQATLIRSPLEAAFAALSHSVNCVRACAADVDQFLAFARSALDESLGDPFSTDQPDLVARIRRFALQALGPSFLTGSGIAPASC